MAFWIQIKYWNHLALFSATKQYGRLDEIAKAEILSHIMCVCVCLNRQVQAYVLQAFFDNSGIILNENVCSPYVNQVIMRRI
jgi:hypothetical protein